MRLKRPAYVLLLGAALWPTIAAAQVKIEADGRWRHLFGAGASVASGNSDAASLNLSADSVRATPTDKWSFTGRALYARSEGQTSGERLALGSQYNRDLSARWFGFASGDLLRDRPANLSRRMSVASGVGHHVLRSERAFWDVSAGLGYTRDRYLTATEIDDRLRTRSGRSELVLGQESRNQLTDSTAVQQKLSVLFNVHDGKDYRAVFESNLSVAINRTLSLTAGLSYRHDSEPGAGFEKGDALFVTGLSYRLD